MDYVQITDPQRRAMLQKIGVHDTDQLYANLPLEYRLKAPLSLSGLTTGLSELDLQRELNTRAGMNRAAGTPANACFLGGGAYDHFIPSVVDALAGQGAFVTAYTPYQAEASQGSLQAFFEFQTQVCRLTGMEVANASLYEGATAVAEAVLMAMRATGKRRVLVAPTLHPHYKQVLETYLAELPAELVTLTACAQAGRVEPKAIEQAVQAGHGDTACVVIQSPNVFGVIEDWSAQFAVGRQDAGSDRPPLMIAVFNPIACGLLKSPGTCGADIAAGEGQPLGLGLQYGGPYLGLLAAKPSLMRRMPGRLVGQTHDMQGKRGFCLTLQTREQHIRGAKATSNVCTNQGLMAMRAGIYLSSLGPIGLKEVAQHCYHKAHHAADRIGQLPGYRLAYDGPFFHEFVIDCPVPARRMIDAGRQRGILPGLSCHELGIGSEHQLLVAVTENRTAGQINALAELLKEVGANR